MSLTGLRVNSEVNPTVLPAFELLQNRGVKIVVGGQWQQAPFFMQSRLEKRADEIGSVYGLDWVNIGYKPGGTTTWRAIMEDFWKGAAGVDCNGTKFDELPLMHRVRKLDILAATLFGRLNLNISGTWIVFSDIRFFGKGGVTKCRYLCLKVHDYI